MSTTIWNTEEAGYLADLPEIVPVPQIAAGLGRSPRTIRDLISTGKLPGVYLPGSTRVGMLREDVIEAATPKRVQPIRRDGGQ